MVSLSITIINNYFFSQLQTKWVDKILTPLISLEEMVSILIIFLQLLSKPTMQLLSKLIYFVTITLLVLHILLVVSFCNCICNYKNGGPTF
jgi:hypothetical protein